MAGGWYSFETELKKSVTRNLKYVYCPVIFVWLGIAAAASNSQVSQWMGLFLMLITNSYK